MAELVRRTFRVTLDVTVSANEIDEALIKRHKKYFHDPAMANHPETLEAIARDRRLLATLLSSPHVLSRVLALRAADSLESIDPDDTPLADLQTSERTQAQMILDLREALSEEDYAFHKGSCDERVFYDNSMYFQDAFTARQFHVTLQEPPDDRDTALNE
jgi:hypothetical protein